MGIPSNSISSIFLPQRQYQKAQRQYQKYFSSHIQIVASVLNPPDAVCIVACLVCLCPT